MVEFRNVRQDPDGFKRYFCDDTFDLFVWYDHPGGPITGFQLVYDKGANARAITWLKDKGFRHNKVEGDSSYFNQTPILIKDGVFDSRGIHDLFLAHSQGVDVDITSLVASIIRRYDPKLDDQLV